jgi:hypothetical protein
MLQRGRSAGNILNAMKTEIINEEILMVYTRKRAVYWPTNAAFTQKMCRFWVRGF